MRQQRSPCWCPKDQNMCGVLTLAILTQVEKCLTQLNQREKITLLRYKRSAALARNQSFQISYMRERNHASDGRVFSH